MQIETEYNCNLIFDDFQFKQEDELFNSIILSLIIIKKFGPIHNMNKQTYYTIKKLQSDEITISESKWIINKDLIEIILYYVGVSAEKFIILISETTLNILQSDYAKDMKIANNFFFTIIKLYCIK